MKSINNALTENEISQMLEAGGAAFLKAGCYNLSSPVMLGESCGILSGENWYYPADPNGVFEADGGVKLRTRKKGYPGVCIGKDKTVGGAEVSYIGIQGDIDGMDTRGLFDAGKPSESAGICFDSQRTDQCRVTRVSCCGLAAGVTACGDAELDACIFENLNTDGCCVGVWFAPRASFYTAFRCSVIADTPLWGFCLDNRRGGVRSLDINDVLFVRNGGAFEGREGADIPAAAVCLAGAKSSRFRDCHIDASGTFWLYADDATRNDQRQPHRVETPALVISGCGNVISGNVISHSGAQSIVLTGDGNNLMNNTVDNDIVVRGKGNYISNVCFTTTTARLILCGADAAESVVFGVQNDRIVYSD